MMHSDIVSIPPDMAFILAFSMSTVDIAYWTCHLAWLSHYDWIYGGVCTLYMSSDMVSTLTLSVSVVESVYAKPKFSLRIQYWQDQQFVWGKTV